MESGTLWLCQLLLLIFTFFCVFQLSRVWDLIRPIVDGLKGTDQVSPSSPTTKSPINSPLNNGITV